MKWKGLLSEVVWVWLGDCQDEGRFRKAAAAARGKDLVILTYSLLQISVIGHRLYCSGMGVGIREKV